MGIRGSMSPVYKRIGKEKVKIGYNIGGEFIPIEKYVKIPLPPKNSIYLDPMSEGNGEKKVEFPQKKGNFLRKKHQ
jgi:hypothetical protein